MQYSPKLKRVMEEIKTLLRKEDIAGIVVIHEPGFSEYVHVLQPSYSCVVIKPDAIGFEMAKKHFKTEHDRKSKLTNTSNMMEHLSKITGQIAMNLLDASASLYKVLGAEHFGGGHTSDDQQNN